jgi:hypothetical protein
MLQQLQMRMNVSGAKSPAMEPSRIRTSDRRQISQQCINQISQQCIKWRGAVDADMMLTEASDAHRFDAQGCRGTMIRDLAERDVRGRVGKIWARPAAPVKAATVT